MDGSPAFVDWQVLQQPGGGKFPRCARWICMIAIAVDTVGTAAAVVTLRTAVNELWACCDADAKVDREPCHQCQQARHMHRS